MRKRNRVKERIQCYCILIGFTAAGFAAGFSVANTVIPQTTTVQIENLDVNLGEGAELETEGVSEDAE